MTETAIAEPVVIPDARGIAWLIAHTFRVHGLVPDPFRAMSRDGLPALEVAVDGRRFLINVEELS